MCPADFHKDQSQQRLVHMQDFKQLIERNGKEYCRNYHGSCHHGNEQLPGTEFKPPEGIAGHGCDHQNQKHRNGGDQSGVEESPGKVCLIPGFGKVLQSPGRRIENNLEGSAVIAVEGNQNHENEGRYPN